MATCSERRFGAEPGHDVVRRDAGADLLVLRRWAMMDCEGGHCCPEGWIGNGDCDDHYEFLVHCDLSCYEEDGGDCVGEPRRSRRTRRNPPVPFEGCCFWSSSGDSCGDCDQPAATVDWCSFSRANCESCSNAEWCGSILISRAHAPAPSVQPSPRPSAPQPTDAQTVDGRIILPDGVSCGGGTWHLPQSCETCAGYIDGRNGVQNCVYGVGTNGRWHCKNENSGDILELDNSCLETPEPSWRSRRRARRAIKFCVAPLDSISTRSLAPVAATAWWVQAASPSITIHSRN